MSWRRISSWLNRSGIKTHRGNTWGVTGNSVHSVIKRMKEREQRLANRYKTYPRHISEFRIND